MTTTPETFGKAEHANIEQPTVFDTLLVSDANQVSAVLSVFSFNPGARNHKGEFNPDLPLIYRDAKESELRFAAKVRRANKLLWGDTYSTEEREPLQTVIERLYVVNEILQERILAQEVQRKRTHRILRWLTH